MPFTNYPKPIKRSLRELAGMAYERELARELRHLAGSFDAWQAGEIDVWELDSRIHRYHNGVARRLYNQYTGGPADMLVAYAIVGGLIDRNDVPIEVWPYLERQLAFYRSLADNGELDVQLEESDEER